MEKASEDEKGQVYSRFDYCIERVDTVYNAIEEHVDEISDIESKFGDVVVVRRTSASFFILSGFTRRF